LKEQVQAIQQIWTTDESEFHGRYVNFDRMKAFPKPYQKPHPPVIMGGEGQKAIQFAAEVCDGWAPWFLEWPQGREKIVQFKEQATAHERDPQSLEISLFEQSIPDERILSEMETAGVGRLILTVHAQNRDEVLPRLDQLAEL
jgi:alkanesulfonate monooxygenase SsuD/methylene tetrahydromethanopterin reductase-like flavin-dependent oxidoreductase (luciferase family)